MNQGRVTQRPRVLRPTWLQAARCRRRAGEDSRVHAFVVSFLKGRLQTVEFEIYEALTAINVPADKARAVVDSVNREIDKRYSLHADQLATKTDLAEMEARLLRVLNDMQRWALGCVFGGIAALAVITKLWH